MNKAGPNRSNTDRCETTAITIVVAETVSPRRTNWVLISKYDVIHRRAQSLIPNVCCVRSMRINYGLRQRQVRH